MLNFMKTHILLPVVNTIVVLFTNPYFLSPTRKFKFDFGALPT